MIQNSNHRTDFGTFILGFKPNRQNSGDARYVYFYLQNTYDTQKGLGTMVFKAVRNSRACRIAGSIALSALKKGLIVLFATNRHEKWL